MEITTLQTAQTMQAVPGDNSGGASKATRLKQQWLAELEKSDLPQHDMASKHNNNSADDSNDHDELPRHRESNDLVSYTGVDKPVVTAVTTLTPLQATNISTPINVIGNRQPISNGDTSHRATEVIPGITWQTSANRIDGNIRAAQWADTAYTNVPIQQKSPPVQYADKHIQVIQKNNLLTILGRDYQSVDKQATTRLLSALKDLFIHSGYQIKKILLNGRQLTVQPFNRNHSN